MKSPFAFSFKAFATAVLLAAFATIGFAQGATATGSSTAGAQASTAPIVFNPTIEASQPLAHTTAKVEQTIKSYTAPSAPTAYGAVGGAGCPAIDAISASVFFANGSKATPIELPGCMGLQLAALLLNPNMAISDQGEISWKTAAVLEAQCDFPQYKSAIARMGLKRDGQSWACGGAQQEVVASMPARANANAYSPDPLIAERQRKAGL